MSIDYIVNVLAGSVAGLAAVSGLKAIDDAAVKSTERITELESKTKEASAKLEALKSPPGLADMQARLQGLRDAQDKMRSGALPMDPQAYKHASTQAAALEKQIASASDKAQKAYGAQAEKVDALAKKTAAEKEAVASNASLVAAKRSLAVKALEKETSAMTQLQNKAQEAGLPRVASAIQSLSTAGGAVGVVMALVAALGALAVGVGVAALALTKYAFGAADAARSSRLFSEAALGSAKAGDELEAVVSQMSNVAPGLSTKLKDIGRSLAEVHIRGRDAQRVLTTFGIVATAAGEQAAGSIKGIAETSRMAGRLILGVRDRFGEFASLKGTGVKAADIYAAVAKSMRTSIPEAKRAVEAGLVPFKKGMEALELAAQTKLGGIAAKQVMGLSAQAEKLRENIAKLFAGANIEKFLSGLKLVTDLFDTNTVTGYVLREVFTSVFTSIANLSAKVFPYVKAAIQGVAFGIILVATVAKQLYRSFTDTFGGALKGIDGLRLAFIIGAGLIGGIVGAIVGLTAAFVLLGAVAVVALAPIWIPFALMALFIYGAVKAISAVVEAVKGIGKEIEDIDLGKSAENLMNSLINGIKAKIADVKAAISSVGDAITGAFDAKMEIHSPSRVMERRAEFVVDPLVTVPKEREGEVRSAIGGLGGLDKPISQQMSGAGGMYQITNNFYGTQNADEVIQRMEEWWASKMLAASRGFALAGVP